MLDDLILSLAIGASVAAFFFVCFVFVRVLLDRDEAKAEAEFERDLWNQ